MQLNDLHNDHKHLLLQCISGSRAYGLNTPISDTDYKGVFVLPYRQFYGLNYVEQVSNESNDIVYYELKRFIELLTKNNPNLIELLNTPTDCVLFRHPLMELVRPEMFLSRLCKDTFAGYAISQVKKAKGLNKKIANPVDEKRKSISEFCFVTEGISSLQLSKWLETNGFEQENCGLSAVVHFRDMYALFHESQFENSEFNGIYSSETAFDVKLSSIPKGKAPLAYLNFNKDGYSMYCRDYKEYWTWVSVRNEARYDAVLEHGKNYDAKNMMHTFRLLNMAEEIGREKKVNVRRSDREFLMKVRSGAFLYEDLVQMAHEKIVRVHEAFEKSDLPEVPDVSKAEQLLIRIREAFYKEKFN